MVCSAPSQGEGTDESSFVSGIFTTPVETQSGDWSCTLLLVVMVVGSTLERESTPVFVALYQRCPYSLSLPPYPSTVL